MTTMSDDKKIELLNDHYKDTFSQLTEHRKLRDRLFALILLAVIILLFQLYSPNEAEVTIGEFIIKKLQIQNAINVAFVGSVIWFSLLGFVIRYFQSAIYIERQYVYLHDLEEQISKHFQNKAFIREGKFYLAKYPHFSNWTYFLYTIAFPFLLILVVGAKIFNEIYFSTGTTILLNI